MNFRFAAFLASVSVAASVTCATAVVDRSVHRALAEDGKVNLVVRMKSNANVVEKFQEDAFVSRTAKINALKSQLERANAKALQPLGQLFAESASIGSASSIQTYWITPVAYIKDASVSTVQQIAALPNVESVRAERLIPLYQPIIESGRPIESVQGTEWNIQRIQAPQVWADGISGQGVLVGSIDSGVRATHEALVQNFVGEYGWFDPELRTSVPHDDNGHGTHTMSTIAGRRGVGVAPAAKWMSCRGCRSRNCPESDLLTCAQWVVCPTDTDGNNPDCSKAPRLVSNSWGGGQGEFWYKDVVDAWIKAGIVPIFANGNDGPNCTTASSPGDYPNVIGVGSTTILDGLSSFSNRGPSVNGRMKPDISAPGSGIRAARNTSDTDYYTISGTSMATPHVAGSIALLLSAETELSIDDLKVRLFTTTDQSGLLPTNCTCGGTSDAVWPNNQYGHGRLNVFSAYRGFRAAPPTPAPAPVTPKPTTAAPTPAPTSKNEAECNKRIQLWCGLFPKCVWSRERKICTARR